MSEAMYQQPEKFPILLQRIDEMDEILRKLVAIHDLEELAKFEKENSIATILGDYETILKEYSRFDKYTLATLRIFAAAYSILCGFLAYSIQNKNIPSNDLYTFLSMVIPLLLIILYVQRNANLWGDLQELTEKIEDSHLIEVEGTADFIIFFHRTIGAVKWQENKEDIFQLIEYLRRVEFILNKDFTRLVTSELNKRISDRKINISDFYLDLFLILRPYQEMISRDNIKFTEAYNDLMNFITSKLDGNYQEPNVDFDYRIADTYEDLLIHPDVDEG